MKEYEVWIYDDESGCNQPMKCKARSVAEARRAGNEYISSWGACRRYDNGNQRGGGVGWAH